jgi:hypothetical protein
VGTTSHLGGFLLAQKLKMTDGATPVSGSTAQFRSLMASDGGKYGGIVIAAGVKPE